MLKVSSRVKGLGEDSNEERRPEEPDRPSDKP